MNKNTLTEYLRKLKEDDGGSHNSISFDDFKKNADAMSLVRQYHNNEITKRILLKKLEDIGLTNKTMLTEYLRKMEKEAQQNAGFKSQSTEFWDFSNPAPLIQAPQIAQQSSDFISGNPGSLTSALNKGKSTNFSKASNSDNWSLSSITGSASHYGAMPSQQAPMPDTFMPSQTEMHSWDWDGGNLQNDEGSLQSLVNPKNPSSWKRALGKSVAKGAVSNWFGASPQKPQFSPSMHDTFVPFQPGTHSTNFFGGNSQNDDEDLYSVVRNPSSSEGFDATPYLPNHLQSMGLTGNFFSSTPQSSNFNSGNPGSASHYGGAMPSQQAPMPGTSFSSFPNYPFNQSAPLNPSTNFGKDSWDWSGGNSQNNEGDLYSVVRPKKPSSSKGKSATKTGKKQRK